MTAGRVPAGRAGRMWLRHRVGVSTRGADELDRKVQLVTSEVVRRRQQAERCRAEWSTACEEATRWMLRAGFVGGIDAVRQAWITPVEVEFDWTVTIGVRHVGGVTIGAIGQPDAAMSAAVMQARQAFVTAFRAAAEVAMIEVALVALEAALLTTRRRARVLRRHWVPRLQAQLHDLEIRLEQAEQEDQVRLRRAVT